MRLSPEFSELHLVNEFEHEIVMTGFISFEWIAQKHCLKEGYSKSKNVGFFLINWGLLLFQHLQDFGSQVFDVSVAPLGNLLFELVIRLVLCFFINHAIVVIDLSFCGETKIGEFRDIAFEEKDVLEFKIVVRYLMIM